MINLLELPSGIIADTYGRKNALAGSFLIYIVSFFFFYYFDGFWWYWGAFMMYGVGDAFRSGTHKGMIMDYLKQNGWADQKINYYGHTRSWSQMGSAISSLVAGFVVFYSGRYESIFMFSILPYGLNFFLILSYPQSINFASKAKVRPGFRQTFRAFFERIKRKEVLAVISSSALFSAYLKAVKDYIQPIMVQVAVLIPILLNVDLDKKNGVVIGFFYFLIYLMTSSASRFSSVFDSKAGGDSARKTMLWGLIMGIICGIFYSEALSVLALLAFVGIYLVENLRKPILTAYVSRQVSNDILTSVLSAQSLLKTLFTTIIALVFGYLADLSGIGLALIIVSLGLLGIGVLLSSVRIN